MEKILKFINDEMESIGIPYEFDEWKSPVVYPYWVGEIGGESITTEDGQEQVVILLTGFHRGNMIDLLSAVNRIKNHFPAVYGLRGAIDGCTIAVYYDGMLPIPSGEADLKKVQINLKVNAWKGAA